ncbi:LLM class flavin-dependent oxidoreductase [Mycolicibacterium helvum]|uniref:N5,N10-methylene tetrahydromethanopterin reductase n=1 Tax=Mycolicibacterium helvum TaxID=1534349 RepID=A0A7I7T9U7_9MYCO|nr:LLM class flavin-dependent oxidoreductase [Mycolicibacterium helvum]BBY64906.1 N5,N10-methylene tetrahydromethanopterin reductase [Mycolicibacterium helvum]
MSAARVLFGLGLPPDLAAANRILPQAKACDAAGLDVVSIPDHPNFADRVDAYAAVSMVLGATRQLRGVVNLTNIGIRSAPLLARTVASLSALSDGRIIVGVGAGSLWDELARLGVTPRSPAESVQAMEETITVMHALTGGGPPVDFAGQFYQLRGADPSPQPTPAIWTGSQGPRSLAITGRLADGWIPAHTADWRSPQVKAWRPVIDDAAVAAGRSPADIVTIYNVGGQITDRAVLRPRDEEGRWVGGSTEQWIDELTSAVIDYDAAGLFYLRRDLSDSAVGRWMHEIVPAVRRAIAESNERHGASG